jgi:hypothetical protein
MAGPPAASSPEVHVTQPPTPPPRHPIGTLIIVGVYGLLFALGWLAVYFFVFRARGAVGP